jgi:phosphate transport system substrate-binding protein
MKLATRAITATVLPAILLSACSGGSSQNAGGQSLPAQRHIASLRSHDSGSGLDLHAGGATFPGYAYNLASQPTGLASQPQAGPGAGSLFASAGTTGTIYYCLTGSGFGQKIFIGSTPANSTAPCAALGLTPTGFGGAQDPPDFVGADPLASTQYPTYKTNREPSTGTNYGEPFEFPAITGPVTFAYQRGAFPAFEKKAIQFSRWTYCAIANGTVTDWNDPAITADNGGVSVTGGTSEPITFFYRSDSSGTSNTFQTHLATVCGSAWLPPYSHKPYQTASRNAAWTHGFGQTWLGPTTGNFIGANGDPGIQAALQTTKYGTGYVEGAYAYAATGPRLKQALLQDSNGDFADPTNPKDVAATLKNVAVGAIQFGEGIDGLPLATTRPDCILLIPLKHFINPVTPHAYPILNVSYLLFYGNSNGVHTADRLKLIDYLTSTAANTIVNSLEYAPLNKGIQKVINQAANGTGSYTGKPCIQ